MTPNLTRPSRYFSADRRAAQAEHFDKAIADFTAAIQLEPKRVHFYRDRAVSFRSKGDLESAIADCTLAIGLKATADDYWLRGDTLLEQGSYLRAKEDFETALRMAAEENDARVHALQSGMDARNLSRRHAARRSQSG